MKPLSNALAASKPRLYRAIPFLTKALTFFGEIFKALTASDRASIGGDKSHMVNIQHIACVQGKVFLIIIIKNYYTAINSQ